MPQFRIRQRAGPDDAAFIAAAFDSTLPHLASIGSGKQWGTELWSQKENFTKEVQAAIHQSEVNRTTGEGEYVRVLIAEVEGADLDGGSGSYREDETGEKLLMVGAAIIQKAFSPYLVSDPKCETIINEANARDDFIFLRALASDFRTGSFRRGAGAALVDEIKMHARLLGKKAVYVDCWAGNDGKLVAFYERQGFRVVAPFEIVQPDKPAWPGAFLRLDIAD
ncbi:predicted protein [Uncinocarpus reesii 1704]|uniref:N-acetyltransferase domain-containing protein n=1 Tax=Uncinocarpus reesii (strain UAMH 1704) TaxID=336963 RepID=C4JGB4_UNCRE|nr:uncharacterized protein UREG_02512 [Uncinocarpus reesii 1704]EEP77663.1 predicted protein [Uncinocarpus reesii 1704]